MHYPGKRPGSLAIREQIGKHLVLTQRPPLGEHRRPPRAVMALRRLQMALTGVGVGKHLRKPACVSLWLRKDTVSHYLINKTHNLSTHYNSE